MFPAVHRTQQDAKKAKEAGHILPLSAFLNGLFTVTIEINYIKQCFDSICNQIRNGMLR